MKFIVLIIACLCCLGLSAQVVPDSVIMAAEDSVGFKLAELAIANNPNIKVADKQVESRKYAVKAMKGSWLNVIQPSFNVNEFSLNGNVTPAGQSIFYPRYNLNVSLPIGLFFTKGNQVKESKAQYEEAGARKEVEKSDLRRSVRQAYENYQFAKTLVGLQQMVVQDEQVLYEQVETKFKNNQVQLEAFTNSSKRYNAEVVKQATLVNDLKNARIDLETLIGMDLDAALALISKK